MRNREAVEADLFRARQLRAEAYSECSRTDLIFRAEYLKTEKLRRELAAIIAAEKEAGK